MASLLLVFSALDASGCLWLFSHSYNKNPPLNHGAIASVVSLLCSLLTPIMQGMFSIFSINKRGTPGSDPD